MRAEASYNQTSYSPQENMLSLWIVESTWDVICCSISKWSCGEISVSSDDNKRHEWILSKLWRVENDRQIVYSDQVVWMVNLIKNGLLFSNFDVYVENNFALSSYCTVTFFSTGKELLIVMKKFCDMNSFSKNIFSGLLAKQKIWTKYCDFSSISLQKHVHIIPINSGLLISHVLWEGFFLFPFRINVSPVLGVGAVFSFPLSY